MKRRVQVELPPIADAWQEVSLLHRAPYNTYAPTMKREEHAGRALKHVRTLVSLEEVFGAGLLARFELARTRATLHDQLLERLRRGG